MNATPSISTQSSSPPSWLDRLWAERWAVLILGIAAVLRLACLEMKPPHFDEGVNGNFVDQMGPDGFYHYDPTNYHGPLHFYCLFIAQTLFGRHVWALRFPLVLISTACVGLILAMRPYFGRPVTRIAALAMALSPGMAFYGRYAIHETWLLFFLLMSFWGLAGIVQQGQARHLWAAAFGATGMILTKETYLVHLACFGLAALSLRALHYFAPSSSARALIQWPDCLPHRVAAVCLTLIVLFYSGFFLDWSSLPGLWQTFGAWFTTGTQGESGHEKAFYYWIELLGRYELPSLLGLLAAPFLALGSKDRILRYLAIYGTGALTAYSLIAYKTPWCIISLIWPFQILFAVVAVRAWKQFDPWLTGSTLTVLLGLSLGTSCLLNFRNQTDESEPYVYVQTLPDVNRLLGPLQQLAQQNPNNFHLTGYILSNELHPWTWLLADFSAVTMGSPTEMPANLSDAQFILVDETIAAKVEAQLTDPFYCEPIRVRGGSADNHRLYLRARTFAQFFPDRIPECVPVKPIPAL